jgi:hypothetical protein
MEAYSNGDFYERCELLAEYGNYSALCSLSIMECRTEVMFGFSTTLEKRIVVSRSCCSCARFTWVPRLLVEEAHLPCTRDKCIVLIANGTMRAAM